MLTTCFKIFNKNIIYVKLQPDLVHLCFLTRLSAETIKCICENTVCQVTKGVCHTHFGCFSSSLIEEDKVTKGCLKNEAHKEIICQTEPDHPVICCNTNFCNMNVTADILNPTEKKCK